jgi:serine/threonine-protein kinase
VTTIARTTDPGITGPFRTTTELPAHLVGWQLPPGWKWGAQGVVGGYRHSQEVLDALGRSLALVTAPQPEHAPWLATEAQRLAHRNHPAVPTTYHYWTTPAEGFARRGPGYLRRWIEGETIGARTQRVGAADLPFVLHTLRGAGSALAYLHDSGEAHGAISPFNIWIGPTGRLWFLAWQWSVPRDAVPAGLEPDRRWHPPAPEWRRDGWLPDARSDQWQLAAVIFLLLTGEPVPCDDIPPVRWVRPEVPQSLATALDRALCPVPDERHRSVSALLRALDRTAPPRLFLGGVDDEQRVAPEGTEARLRWALADDYEVLAPLGQGTFGTVWRVRDLALQREVALRCCTHRSRKTRSPSDGSVVRRSSRRNSRIPRSCRSTIGISGAMSRGTRWSSRKAARSRISWPATVPARSPRSRRKSIRFSMASSRRTRSGSCTVTSSLRTS